MPADFVLHSLRHSCEIGSGEAGADAFTIARLAPHRSVMVSQQHVLAKLEALARAVERLETLNEKAAGSFSESQGRQLLAAISAIVPELLFASN
jgi:hypothetical protein